MNNERWAACTIASANYLDFVMTSYESFFRYHPGQRFFVLIVDEPEQVAQRDYPFEVVYAKDLPIRDFCEVAFRFDVLELNTNVKPTFLKHLLQRGDIANVLLPKNIFDAILSLDFHSRVLLIGSSAEYGFVREQDNPITEEHSLRPVSIYGLTKVFQTQLMQYYVQAKGIDAVMARTFNLFSPSMSEKLFVGRLYKQIAQFKAGEIEKIVLGNLESKRDYIEVEEAVKQYANIMNNGRSGEVYNVGSGYSIQIAQLLRQILSEKGLCMENVQTVDWRGGPEVTDIFADISKLKNIGVKNAFN